MTEHRRIHNGEDNLDTCAACAWASWDTAPSFAEHVELMAAVDAEQEGRASYAAEQERHAETIAAARERQAETLKLAATIDEARARLVEKTVWLETRLARSVSWSEVIRALRAADVPEDSMATDDDQIRYEGRAEAVAIMRDMLGV